MIPRRLLFKIQCRLPPAAPNLTSIQNKMPNSNPLYLVQYSFIPAINFFSFPTLLWSKLRQICLTLRPGSGNVIPLDSLTSPPRLHSFPGLKSRTSLRRTNHQHLEVPEKDGNYFVSPFMLHCCRHFTFTSSFRRDAEDGGKISI